MPSSPLGRNLSLQGLSWDDEATTVAKVTYVFEWPFSLLRHLSIPSANFTNWGRHHRKIAATSVVGAALILVFDFDDPMRLVLGRRLSLGVVVLLCGTFGGVGVLALTTADRRPSLNVKTGLVLVGFISTIAWLNLLAGEAVAVLESLGASAGLSSAVLGVTALAWGNCIGDVVADTAVARAGNTSMAVASIFNSPLFSQIMALGFPVAYYCANHGPLHIALSPQAVLSFVTIAISLSMTTGVAWRTNARLKRGYAFVLFTLYTVYLALSVAFELDLVRALT